jgi:hypothetical protein
MKVSLASIACLFMASGILVSGCGSQTPQPTDQGKKDFMGRKPTEEELKAAQSQAADRMKEVGAGTPPPGN